ncbi:hypothetical protein Tco_1386350 [Tanacetum coccineum]
MMILESRSDNEEIHGSDHQKILVFLVNLHKPEKCLENVLALVLMEYLLMEHPGQWKLTQENRLKPQLSEQQLLELEKQQLLEEGGEWNSSNIGLNTISHSFLDGGTNGAEGGGFGMSPELCVAGVIELSPGPELDCSEAIAISSLNVT